MSDEDERVTEFVQILSNAVDREAENKALRAQRDELLEALEEIVKEYCENPDNGRTLRWAIDGAKEAIAKAKGEE